MRIRGFLSRRFEPPAPLIEASIYLPSMGERQLILLIDTGASATTILDSDAGRFGITLEYARENLRPAPRKVLGIGGVAETYMIEGAELTLTQEDGLEVGEALDLYIVLHDPETLSDEVRGLILRLPSLLGRDLINRYRLYIDAGRDEVYLER